MSKLDKLEEVVKIVKAQEEVGLAKAKNIIEDVKNYNYEMPDVSSIKNIFKKEEEPVMEKKCECKCKIGVVIAVILGIIAVAAAIYGLYCYFTPDYLDDFDDEFEDDEFEDDDFFEDEFKD